MLEGKLCDPTVNMGVKEWRGGVEEGVRGSESLWRLHWATLTVLPYLYLLHYYISMFSPKLEIYLN